MFACQGCGYEELVPTKRQVEGYEFACAKCGRRHRLVDRVWQYSAEIGDERRVCREVHFGERLSALG